MQFPRVGVDRGSRPAWRSTWAISGSEAPTASIWMAAVRRPQTESVVAVVRPSAPPPAAARKDLLWQASSPPRSTSARPPAGRRPAPPVGTAGPSGPAQAGPGPPRLPEQPREDHLPGRSAETRKGRSRTAARLEEPPARRPARRRQEPRAGHGAGWPPEAAGLKRQANTADMVPLILYARHVCVLRPATYASFVQPRMRPSSSAVEL